MTSLFLMSNLKNILKLLIWKYSRNICRENRSPLYIYVDLQCLYEGESIKNQPNLLLGEIDLFFFDLIAL